MPALLDQRRPSTVRLRERAIDLVGLITTPLVPSDYLDLISPLRSAADLRGRIVEIIPETPDAATVVIRPGRGWAGHVPGQYIRIGIDVDGVRQWRAYSLTSPVGRADGCIAITVKVIPDGAVSTHLVRRARAGTLVHLDQACGEFVLPPQRPAKVLFVTAGSGITPVMGMLDAEQLTTLVADAPARETWACGPAAMLDGLETFWAQRGIADRLHTERFRPTVLATGEGGTVTFTSSEVELDADGSTSLLDAGENAGVLMPSGCRMGICFGCVAPLREGSVRDLRTGELTHASPGDGVIVQTCVSAAAGRCEIEL